jgi:alkylation response protein AidB-like acyl-CoA dehydrogenase
VTFGSVSCGAVTPGNILTYFFMSRAADATAWIAANWQTDLTLAQWWQRLFDAGYAFPAWPEGLGGFGATAAESRLISAALAAANVIGPPSGNGPTMGGPTLLAHASVEQKQRFLPAMASGQHQWCQLFSEPGAGSDLASLGTQAERDGDEFVVNGQKVWNSRADVSEWGMLLARTDSDVPKHAGLTFVMIDMNQPGVEVRPLVQMNGAAEFCEVFLTDARARVADVIGAVSEGWKVARTTLTHERAGAAAGRSRGLVDVLAGAACGNLDKPVGELIKASAAAANDPTKRMELLLSSRTMMGLATATGAAANPVSRDQLMRYHVHCEVYRLNGQRMRDESRKGRSTLDGSLMKLDLALMAHESRDLSLSLLGAEGMLTLDSSREHGRYQRAALSSFVPSLGGGTNEIQRNIIGERTLGLPREPGTDNDVPFRDLRRS